MKQHITREQIKEIDFATVLKLCKFLPMQFQHTQESEPERFVTSGRMIEILGDKLTHIEHCVMYDVILDLPTGDYDLYHTKRFECDELVDALWEAIKEIL